MNAKFLLFQVCLLGFVAQLYASELPKAIAESHFTIFESSTITNWASSKTEEGELFLIEFTQDSKRNEAYYNESGELYSHLSYLQNIPNNIQMFVENQFENGIIKHLVFRTKYEKGMVASSVYTVLIKSDKGIFPISLSLESTSGEPQLIAQGL